VAAAVAAAGPVDPEVLQLVRSQLGSPLGSSDTNACAPITGRKQGKGNGVGRAVLEVVPLVLNALARDPTSCDEPTKLEVLELCARALKRLDPGADNKLKTKARWTVHKYVAGLIGGCAVLSDTRLPTHSLLAKIFTLHIEHSARQLPLLPPKPICRQHSKLTCVVNASW
jgi:hypothetical protein